MLGSLGAFVAALRARSSPPAASNSADRERERLVDNIVQPATVTSTNGENTLVPYSDDESVDETFDSSVPPLTSSSDSAVGLLSLGTDEGVRGVLFEIVAKVSSVGTLRSQSSHNLQLLTEARPTGTLSLRRCSSSSQLQDHFNENSHGQSDSSPFETAVAKFTFASPSHSPQRVTTVFVIDDYESGEDVEEDAEGLSSSPAQTPAISAETVLLTSDDDASQPAADRPDNGSTASSAVDGGAFSVASPGPTTSSAPVVVTAVMKECHVPIPRLTPTEIEQSTAVVAPTCTAESPGSMPVSACSKKPGNVVRLKVRPVKISRRSGTETALKSAVKNATSAASSRSLASSANSTPPPTSPTQQPAELDQSKAMSTRSTTRRHLLKRVRVTDEAGSGDELSLAAQSREGPPGVKRRRVLDSSSETPDEESEEDEEAVASSSRSSAQGGRRPKGDAETRAREYVMAHPAAIFPDAETVLTEGDDAATAKKGKTRRKESRSKAKGAPEAVVPPVASEDRSRSRKTKRAITKLANNFVADQDATLYFSELQHSERLQVLRHIIPLTYAGARNVEPMLRLLMQNGRGDGDPLVMLAATLRPELINTLHCTQASSAHLTIFNYLVPLFVQRWGIMLAGVAAQPQWRCIGLMYGNWNWYGRWPELLMVAPTLVEQLARAIFSDTKNAVSNFQTLLGKRFAAVPDALAKWCYVRRCSKVVQRDKTGKSLYMDIIVPPLSVWLSLLAAKRVAAALTTADEAALPSDLDQRVEYSSAAAYQSAVLVLTKLLAGSNASVAYGNLVAQSLAAPFDGLDGAHWVEYQGDDAAVSAGVEQLQAQPPIAIQMAIDSTDTSTLSVVCHWESDATKLRSILQFALPIPPGLSIKKTHVHTVKSSSASSSAQPLESSHPQVDEQLINDEHGDDEADSPPINHTSSTEVPLSEGHAAQLATTSTPYQHDDTLYSVQISGVRGTPPEDTLRQIFAACGELHDLRIEESLGTIVLQFANSKAMMTALLAVYGTTTRASHVHAIGLEHTGEMVIAQPSTAHVTNVKGKGKRIVVRHASAVAEKHEGELATSLLLARAPGEDFIGTLQTTMTALSAFATFPPDQWGRSAENDATVIEIGKRFVALPAAPYDFYAARLDHCTLFTDSTQCTPDVFLFFVREVVLAHLQRHPNDAVFVTPPEWLDTNDSLLTAVEPFALFAEDGSEVNVTHCRLLFCPVFVNQRPILIYIAFPEAYDCFKLAVVPPFIVVLGHGLTAALIRKLLLFVWFRLETLLQTPTAVARGRVAIVSLGRVDDVPEGEAAFDVFLQLAHAAHVLLKLASAVDSLSLRNEFFTDAALLTKFRSTLHALIQDSDGNAQMESIARKEDCEPLVEWRALSALAQEFRPLDWHDAVLLAAYTTYAAIRYQRAQKHPSWNVARTTPTLEVIKKGYELIGCELRQYGKVAQRAFCARLQQLKEAGFHVIGASDEKLELCRRGTEFASLSLWDFALRQHDHLYTFQEEVAHLKVGWGGVPEWKN